MYLSRLEAMSNWPIPATKLEVQAFFVFANYYCQFLISYIAKLCPVINLTTDVSFTCRHSQQQALMNYKYNCFHLPSSSNWTEPLRELWKPILIIKRLLVSCLNIILSTDVSSFIQLSTMQKPTSLHKPSGSPITSKCSLSQTIDGNGGTISQVSR